MARNERLNRILVLVDELRREAFDAASDELEEITDEIIDEIIERIPLPRWVPFVRGWVRRQLDDLLPFKLIEAIGQAIVRLKARKAAEGPALGQ